MADLKDGKVEGADAVQVAEPTTPTQPVKTYTQEELDTAVGKGRASTQSQLSLVQAEVNKLKTEGVSAKAENAARLAQIQAMQKEVDEALVDDPERRKAYVSRIASLEREQKVSEREAAAEAKLYEGELKIWQAGMGLKAQQLATEFPGLSAAWLIETCQTEAEMEVKALRWKPEVTPVIEKKESKFDTGLSSGGNDLSGLSPTKKIEAGLMKMK